MQSPSRREVGSKVTTATAKEIEANKLAPEIEKQFSESQRLFPLVLKYLKPSQKLNHISYVLEQNGTIKNVKRLEPIQSKQVL